MKDLPTRLAEYIAARSPIDGKPFSQADFGREIGYSAGQISRYLNGKFIGNLSKLESVIEDVLKSAATRQAEALAIFETNVTLMVNATLERIRRTNDVGLIFGPAGVGKTCGIVLYLKVNLSAILLTATRWNRDAGGIQNLLFSAVETRGYDNRTPRMDFVTRKLKDSNRLLIVDNAQRLTTGALEVLFDLHDATGIGIAFVGNPEVLDSIRKSDQQFSRIGIKKEVQIDKPAKVAEKMVELSGANGHADALTDLAEQVVSQKGHLRALKKQLRLGKEIAAETALGAVDSFRAAHGQLVRDYQLD